MVSENPCVNELQGTKFEFASSTARGSRNHYVVAYSGPKMDVALDILARTVDCAPGIAGSRTSNIISGGSGPTNVVVR